MSNRPPRPKSTEEILREMEAMSEGVGSSSSGAKGSSSGKGAFKSLMDFFIKVEPDEESAAPEFGKPTPQQAPPRQAAPQMPRQPQRVADLVADEPAPRFNAPPAGAAIDDLAQRPFEQIFRDAGIQSSPCTVDQLATLLEDPTVVNQPLSTKILAVKFALSAMKIGIDVPITDAVRRDRALDAYQKMLSDRAATIEQRNQEKIQLLTKEVEEYLKRKQAEMETLRSESAEAQRQMIDFSVRREQEEKRLADLISPFLEGKPSPITVGNQTDEPPPSPGQS